MFDAFKAGYQLNCPTTDHQVEVPLSSFRAIRRLPATERPVLYRVRFDCGCGATHDSLISHDDLDWSPLGVDTALTWTDVMTGRRELVASEMLGIAGDMIARGNWPWVFYCHPESAMRPAFPSAVRMVAPSGDRTGVLVRCASCRRHSVNLVTREHVDVPFYNDTAVAYVATLVPGDRMSEPEAFRASLESGELPTRWTDGGTAA